MLVLVQPMVLALANLTPAYGVTFHGENGKIAFVRQTGNEYQASTHIYSINPDGTGLRRLTNSLYDSEPSWSPDGSKIAFVSLIAGNLTVYVMDADGTNKVQLIKPGVSNTTPSWSPDGSKIVYSSNKSGRFQIYVMNADGSNQTRLTAFSGDLYRPKWSPDGQKIIFYGFGTTAQIFSMNPDGSDMVQLTTFDPNEHNTSPNWSPDGSKIVFSKLADSNYQIHVMNPDGSNETKLTAPGNSYADSSPSWSPDGHKIVFFRTSEVFTMNADGSNQLQLTKSLPNVLTSSSPDWGRHPLSGSELSRTDFNGDGYEDLAIGAPGESVASIERAGAVNIIYGSPSGLSAIEGAQNQELHQGSPGIQDFPERMDGFGSALAVGDFNADGYSDLAISAASEDLGAKVDAGAVNVVYGSPSGLSATFIPDQFWHQDRGNIQGIAKDNDRLGISLTAGDFNGDSYSDLAIGVPGDNIEAEGAGAVNIIYGSSTGLSATSVAPNEGRTSQILTQDSPGIEGESSEGDSFGYRLSAGDYNGDGFDDMAITTALERFFSETGEIEALDGVVTVIYGSTRGLAGTAANDGSGMDDQIWHQNLDSLEDFAEDEEGFGSSLASGDINSDGNDDLMVGVPDEKLDPDEEHAGAVHVIYGSADGLSATAGNTGLDIQFWHQNVRSVQDGVEQGDRFGSSLAVEDFDGDGLKDLAIGVAGEKVGSVDAAGAVNVIFGRFEGLSVEASVLDQLWHQGATAIENWPEMRDSFGYVVTGGDYNGDGYADLAVGVPLESITTTSEYSGAVNVIYGSPTGLSATFVPNQFWSQNSPGIADGSEDGDIFGQSLT